MLRALVLIAALAALCTAHGDVPASPAPPAPPSSPLPLSAYGRLPSLDSPVLSPDGTRYAYVVTGAEGSFLVMQSLDAGTKPNVLRLNDVKLRDLRWADNENLLVLSSVAAHVLVLDAPLREWPMLQVCTFSKAGCRAVRFGLRDRWTMNAVWGLPEVRRVGDRTRVYVTGWHLTDRTQPALFSFDPRHARARLVVAGYASTSGWLLSADGSVAAEQRYDEEEQRWSLHARRGDGSMQEIASRDTSIETPEPIGFTAAGRSIVIKFVENGDPVWRALSLDDGSWSEMPARELAFGRPIVDRLTREVLGSVDERDGRVRFLDAERQRRWDSLVRAFGTTSVRYVAASDSFDQVLLLAFGSGAPPEYRLLDWPRRRADRIGSMYAEVTTTSEIRAIRYAAADGFQVPAILTLPRGREATRLPLVVLPHGGPAAYDPPDFHWWAQALASRGYAVLQPNYRGSSLEWRHLAAGFGEWGRKMQTDLSDGVAHLVASGIADPQRVCIAGADYGGYAALAGVTLQSGIYRCAVAVGGLSDPADFLRWVNRMRGLGDRRRQRYWERFLGVTNGEDPLLQTISPLAHADRVKVPVLLVHGKHDTVVPFEQSKMMEQRLRVLGAAVMMVELHAEDHSLSRSETRLQMLESIVAFLEEHNPAY